MCDEKERKNHAGERADAVTSMYRRISGTACFSRDIFFRFDPTIVHTAASPLDRLAGNTGGMEKSQRLVVRHNLFTCGQL